MRFPNNMRSERVKSGLTAEQIAEELGVSVNTVRTWERGETEPSVTKAVKLAAIFGCTVDYLFAMTDERVA